MFPAYNRRVISGWQNTAAVRRNPEKDKGHFPPCKSFIPLKNYANGAKTQAALPLFRLWAICTKAISPSFAKPKKRADNVVVSIFVNRLQFGQGEDFDKYPRTLQQDADKLANEGVAVVFAPDEKRAVSQCRATFQRRTAQPSKRIVRQIPSWAFSRCRYCREQTVQHRPTRYRLFRQKDYQQLAIIKGFVEDLNFNIDIVPVDTGRAADGLALSSRNQYLSEAERAEAPRLYRELQRVAAELKNGNLDYVGLETETVRRLTEAGWVVDYVEIAMPKASPSRVPATKLSSSSPPPAWERRV